MKLKKTVSLTLAALITLSSGTLMLSCGKKTDDSLKLSKRTNVYRSEELDLEIPSYVSRFSSNETTVLANYDTTKTIVYDTENNAVKSLDGYYYEFGGGYYEDGIVYGYTEEFVVSNVASGLSSVIPVSEEEAPVEDTTDISDSGITEADGEEASAVPEENPVEILPATEDIAEIGVIEEPAVIVPGSPEQEVTEIDGEPDEYGIIVDENTMNISLPDGFWLEYTNESHIKLIPLDGGEAKDIVLAVPEDIANQGYLSELALLQDGNIVAFYSVWSWDEQTMDSNNILYYMMFSGDDGSLLSNVVFSDKLKEAGVENPSDFSFADFDADGGFSCGFYDGTVCSVDKDLNLLQKVTVNGNLSRGYSLGDGKILISCYDDNYVKLSYSLLENGQTTPLKADSLKEYSNFYNAAGVVGTKIYFESNDGVYTWDYEADTIAKELDFINSDIDSSNLNGITLLSETTMLAMVSTWTERTSSTEFFLLTKVPDEEIKEEVIVRLASVWDNYMLRKAVIGFNKQNTGVRVSIESYAKYNNDENEYTGATTKLNNDIISGTLPDIVLLDSSLPVESYFHKNVFTDLNAFIDGENGLDRSKLLENVLKANETDGKLYSLITHFSIETLAAKSKYVGNEPGWTLAEMMDCIKKMPDGMSAFYGQSRETVAYYFFNNALMSLIDWETGDTLFDTPEFVSLIEYMKTCPEKGIWEEYYEAMGDDYQYDEEKEREMDENNTMRFWKDLSLFDTEYLSNFSDIVYLYNTFGSRDVTMIGFPTNDETSNGAVIMPALEFAISSKSNVKDEAWSFVKYLMEGDALEDYSYYFAVNREEMEQKADEAIENAGQNSYSEEYHTNVEWLKNMGYSDDYINFMVNSNQKLDRSMVDEVFELVKNADIIERTDDEVLEIINEELSGFYAGTKSAEETAKVIASRVKIMVSVKS